LHGLQKRRFVIFAAKFGHKFAIIFIAEYGA
jgi:hypothetical protein